MVLKPIGLTPAIALVAGQSKFQGNDSPPLAGSDSCDNGEL